MKAAPFHPVFQGHRAGLECIRVRCHPSKLVTKPWALPMRSSSQTLRHSCGQRFDSMIRGQKQVTRGLLLPILVSANKPMWSFYSWIIYFQKKSSRISQFHRKRPRPPFPLQGPRPLDLDPSRLGFYFSAISVFPEPLSSPSLSFTLESRRLLLGSFTSDKKPQDDPKNDEGDANQKGWDDDDFILLLLDNWVGN